MIGQWLAWFVPEAERLILHQRLARTGPFSKVFRFQDWVVAGTPLPPARLAVVLPPALGEEQGYLFSYCDDPVWESLEPAWVERLLGDPEHLDQLPGDFSFARLRASGIAQVVRSCGGQGPWHFSCAGGRVVVSTRLDWIAQTQPQPIELDPFVCVMTARGLRSAPLPRSVLCDTQTLRPGHVVVAGPEWSNPAIRYFRPEPLTLPPPSEEHRRFAAVRLRELLFRKIDAELAPEGNLVLYSGGLDSSLLVGIARELAIPMHATTLLPYRTDPILAREAMFTDLLSSAFLSHDRVNATPELMDELVQVEGLTVTRYFGGLPRRSLRRGSVFATTMIGYRADEIFGRARSADWINATSLLALPGMLRTQPRDFPLGSWWVQRRWSKRHGLPFQAQLDPMFAPAIREEFRDFYAEEDRRTTQETPAFRLAQLIRYQDCSGAFAEAAAVQGMRAVLPFVQRGVLELGFLTPPRELFHNRMAKVPLRHAARGLLPDVLIDRVDKGHWSGPALSSAPVVSAADQTLAPFLDNTWLGKQAASARLLVCLRQLCIAKERLTHEQRTFFGR